MALIYLASGDVENVEPKKWNRHPEERSQQEMKSNKTLKK